MVNEFNNDEDDDEYDILEDIEPEDYILVLDGNGNLRGISLPEDITDEDDIPESIAKIVTLLLEKATDSKPTNQSLH